jgi:hypothetical protein
MRGGAPPPDEKLSTKRNPAMNARAQTRDTTSQQDFLKHLNFQPVFNSDGQIVDIRELEISTDTRNGVASMRELFNTSAPGDDILGADGWTGKQRRILSNPAPLEAHYLRYSQKWDARTGMMRDAALIQLPFDVIWTLFELLFEGQYSVEIRDIFNEDEEVVPVGTNHQGEQADDAPGRRFFARATVAILLHLPGQTRPREYHGVGVSYGQLRTEKTGNIYAINSERRTVDKGAISDAKREALSNMGRVFRRAFEDGDEMVQHVEQLLLARIHEMNRPVIHQKSKRDDSVPAPVRKASKPASSDTQGKPDTATQAPETKKTVSEKVPAPKAPEKKAKAKPSPENTHVSVVLPGASERKILRNGFGEIFLDILFETCSTVAEAEALIAANEKTIMELVPDRSDIDEAARSMTDEVEDEIPDFGVPASKEDGTANKPEQVEEDEAPAFDPESLRIEVSGKSGKQVLTDLQSSCETAKSVAEINAIISANPAALRKLTPKQVVRFSEIRAELEAKLKSK